MARLRRTHPRAPATLGIRATDSRALLTHATKDTTAAESTAYRAKLATQMLLCQERALARRPTIHHRAPATVGTQGMDKPAQLTHAIQATMAVASIACLAKPATCMPFC